MTRRPIIAAVIAALAGATACSFTPRGSRLESEPRTPDQLVNFDPLYRQNCSGCHGRDGRGGPATSIGDPTYLAIADDATLHRATANGVSGTPMPAFAQSAGGLLTDKQIDILVSGIRSHWANAGAVSAVSLPPYSAQGGDSAHGPAVFATYCSSCHGHNGTGGPKAGSIVDGSFLALTSDQGLRTLVIVGHPEAGFPDWRHRIPGHPMSAQEISDVVAWLSSQRPKLPGQPYSSSSQKAGQ